MWNFFLAGTSAYLFSWMVTTIADTYTNQVDSLWELTCDPNRRLETASYTAPLYVIFLTKYLELVDTAFLCLREKPTPFIHVYHHAITICFMWMHLVNHTCVCWLMSTINVGVHVLLYTYYGLAALGIDIWSDKRRREADKRGRHVCERVIEFPFGLVLTPVCLSICLSPPDFGSRCGRFKRYLTMIQITQFVATLVPSVVVLAARTLWETNPSMGDSVRRHTGRGNAAPGPAEQTTKHDQPCHGWESILIRCCCPLSGILSLLSPLSVSFCFSSSATALGSRRSLGRRSFSRTSTSSSTCTYSDSTRAAAIARECTSKRRRRAVPIPLKVFC